MHLALIRKKLLKQRRFRQALAASLVLCILVGLVIVPLENNQPGKSINTLGDGLWWSIQTLTTVGYGDVVPVSTIGRLLGVVMQFMGAVLFGAVIAMIGSSMNRSQEEFYWTRLFQRLDELETKIKYLEKSQTLLVEEAVEPRQPNTVVTHPSDSQPAK